MAKHHTHRPGVSERMLSSDVGLPVLGFGMKTALVKTKENKIMTPMNDGTGPFGQGPIGKGMEPCGGGQGRGQGRGQCRRNGQGQGQGMKGQGRGFGNANRQQREQPTVADANQPVQK